MSTWFNLASARDIIYIRVRVCVCVCVCVRVCVCVHVAISQESKRQVCLPWWPHQTCHALSVGGFKDGIRWILFKQKKKVLYLKKISDVSHIRRIHTVGQHMVNTCLKPIIRWTKSFFQPYFAPKTAVNPLFLRTKTLNVVGLVTLVPLC